MNKQSCGIGFMGWLTILFIGLKLIGYITWSWFWVFSPIIITLGAIIIIIISLLIGSALFIGKIK